MDSLTPPPYLWGDWHATANPAFFVGWCPSCGADLWLSYHGDAWHPLCMSDERRCTPGEIEAGAASLLAAQRAREHFKNEARQIMQTDDPFYGMPAEEYIRALTGQDPEHHFFRCPFHSDSDERTPSLHATEAFWYCHGCQRGGTIYDFGAELWGIEPRRDGFKEIRRRLYAEGMS